jgi:hypothetical protein
MNRRYKIHHYFKFFYYYVLHGIYFFLYLCIVSLLALAYIMKNIVLYIILVAGAALGVTPANAQKPVIELLPTDHQHQHPEAMADTIALGEYAQGQHPVSDTSNYRSSNADLYNKEDGKQRRTGWHYKIFQSKREPDRIRKNSRKGGQILFFKYIHPVQLFIQITALK